MAEVIFIAAADAYTASLENFEAQLRKNRQELNELIIRATKNGEFKVIYDRQMFSGIREWLEDYGYEVEQKTLNDSEKKVWVVSWENAGNGGGGGTR